MHQKVLFTKKISCLKGTLTKLWKNTDLGRLIWNFHFLWILIIFNSFKSQMWNFLKHQSPEPPKWSKLQIFTYQNCQIWFHVKSECHKVKFWVILTLSNVEFSQKSKFRTSKMTKIAVSYLLTWQNLISHKISVTKWKLQISLPRTVVKCLTSSTLFTKKGITFRINTVPIMLYIIYNGMSLAGGFSGFISSSHH